MVFKHHSLDAFYRKPAGAVPAGGQVRLRLCVKDAQESPDIQLRMWNGGEHRYPMRLLGMHDGEAIYEAQVGVCEEPGLLWYRFEAELHGEHIVLGRTGGSYRMRRRRDGQRRELSNHRI